MQGGFQASTGPDKAQLDNAGCGQWLRLVDRSIDVPRPSKLLENSMRAVAIVLDC